MEVHNTDQKEVNNFEMYTLMLIFNNNEKYHVESSNGKYAEVLRYWLKKRRLYWNIAILKVIKR
jgi:hypothetical protein